MLLYGKERSLELQTQLREKTMKYFGNEHSYYIALLFFGDNSSSATYIHVKKNYGEKIGIPCKVFGQEDKKNFLTKKIFDYKKIQHHILQLNADKYCVGIIVQLPLPKELLKYQQALLSSISPSKDIDGLGGVVSGLASVGLIDFISATPKAVLELLHTYQLDNLVGKSIAILGQSNLVGKPLAIECMKKGATVYSFNIDSNPDKMKNICKQSDIIISCTGHIHLVDASFICTNKTQYIIDVGYGHKNGKAVGDVNLASIHNKVKGYTPIPGGVGPLTVSCLFDNVFILQDIKNILKKVSCV